MSANGHVMLSQSQRCGTPEGALSSQELQEPLDAAEVQACGKLDPGNAYEVPDKRKVASHDWDRLLEPAESLSALCCGDMTHPWA